MTEIKEENITPKGNPEKKMKKKGQKKNAQATEGKGPAPKNNKTNSEGNKKNQKQKKQEKKGEESQEPSSPKVDVQTGKRKNSEGGNAQKKKKLGKKENVPKAPEGVAEKKNVKKNKAEQKPPASLNEKCSSAQEYLKKYENDKDNWKFVRGTDRFITESFLDQKKIPQDLFAIVKKYFAKARGNSKTRIIEKSKQILNDQEGTADKVQKIRAKEVLDVVDL